PRRAAVVLSLAVLGLLALAFEGRHRRAGARSGAADLLLVLVPTFLSLWFLHSRAMSRYSVSFAMLLALAAAAGVERLARRPELGFLLTCGLAASFAPEAYREARRNLEPTPPMAALRFLERYVHAGRETIVA